MTARIISSRTDAEVAIADAYGAAKAKLPGSEAVRHLRDDSFGTFAAAGLPNRRIEAWHYTDLRAIMRDALPVAPKPNETALGPINQELAGRPSFGAGRLVIVDGMFAPSLSDAPPDGVSVRSLADVLGEGRPEMIDLLAAKGFGDGDAILALNAAMMQDGVVIEVAPDVEIAEPIEIVYATAAAKPAARFYRSLVIVGNGAKVRVAESSVGQGGRSGQTFGCLIFKVGEKAEVSHTAAITRTEANSLRLDSFVADLGAETQFESFALVDGEGLTRRQLFVRFSGDDAKAALRGVALLQGREHADTTLDVVHAGLGCEGREEFRHILDDSAVGVFQGRIRVQKQAQKDRRQDDEPGIAAVRRGGDAQQARARNFRRRCGLRPRRDLRPASTTTSYFICGPAAFRAARRNRCFWKLSLASSPTRSATKVSPPVSALRWRTGSAAAPRPSSRCDA